ncbi:hypothetical protein TcBrA4_0044400 [Trypanosoma cruzi]|nr:hypothetical protein TcBrA4_0044400 [Trypanosoma cruzi]
MQHLLTSHAVWWTRGAGGSTLLCWASSPGRRREANTTQPAADDVLAVPRSGDEGERLHRCDARAVPWATPVARLRLLCRAAGGGGQWQDVVALPMNEGRVTRNKAIGDGGTWGEEAEIGMSRKTYMWFDLAHRLFSTRGTFRRAMTTCFSVCRCRCSLRLCRAEGSTWGFTCLLA